MQRMEQHIFTLLLNVEGASENVSQLIVPPKSIYNKKISFNKQKSFLILRKC